MARLLWSQKQDVGPSARMGHALVYDSVRQKVVLFGGEGGGDPFGTAPLADTWEWDGKLWKQVADIGPSPRRWHRLAFDVANSVVLLFGGSWSTGAPSGETWRWDGDVWTQVDDTGPDARSQPAMVYDSARSRVVLFGGEAAGSALRGDTWEWDGGGWTQVEDTGPSARAFHAMAFDDARGEPSSSEETPAPGAPSVTRGSGTVRAGCGSRTRARARASLTRWCSPGPRRFSSGEWILSARPRVCPD